jgi:nucleotide-binding universal stress UspA family protein
VVALKRILVATDFGKAADVALTYGRELGRAFGAELDVLYVCEHVVTAFGMDGHVPDLPDLQKELEQTARTRLETLLNDEDRTMLQAKTVLLTSNTPALAIVNYAKEHGTDLILVGTHGRGGVAHLFMGNVAERVVRMAPCPVLTVRHPEREFVLPDALVSVVKA